MSEGTTRCGCGAEAYVWHEPTPECRPAAGVFRETREAWNAGGGTSTEAEAYERVRSVIAGTPATMLGEALGHLGRAEMLAVAAGKERVGRDIRRAMASLQREREMAATGDTSGKVMP